MTVDVKRVLWRVGVPVALQNLISFSLNFVDMLMISSVSEKAVAAVGLANQLFFLLTLITYGFTSGGGVFISQFLGREDDNNIKKTVAATLMMSLFIGMLACLLALFFPAELMRFFIEDETVIAMGVDYLRYASVSYLFTVITFTYMVASRSTGNARLTMTVSAIAVAINVVLDYALIFGKFGLPQMGVAGAALATSIARLMELIIMLFLVYAGRHIIAAKVRHFRSITVDFFKKLIRTSLPVVVNETVWALGVVSYTYFLAKQGASAVAAWQVMRNVFNFFEVGFFGLASASQVLIGMLIGAKKEQEARAIGGRFMRFNILFTLLFMGLIFVSAPSIVKFFHFEKETAKLALNMIRLVTAFLIFKHNNLLYIVGLARGGGDTMSAMLIELTGVWLIGVPLVAMGTWIWKLGALALVGLILVEEIVKSVILYPRYRSGKWIRNVIQDIERD